MFEMGQKRRFRPQPAMSAFPPIATRKRTSADVGEVPEASFCGAEIDQQLAALRQSRRCRPPYFARAFASDGSVTA